MEALGRREDLPFEIQVFSSAEKLCQHGEGLSISLLLVAESDYSEEIENLDIERILILQDGEGPPGNRCKTDQFSAADTAAGSEKIASYPVISKYSSVSAIIRRSMEGVMLSGSLGNASQRPHPVTFIGIYTPVRRCLQTTFAFVTGQLLARSHKVLYLNFETYSGLGRMLGRSFAAELTDLLYFLNGPGQQFLAKLYQTVENVNGLDVCPPAFCGADISQLKEDSGIV